MATAQPSGHIALIRNVDGQGRTVCLYDLDTSAISPVSQAHAVGAPVWSPDGAQLAFEIEKSEGTAICLANVDANSSRVIAHTYAWNRDPRWSPDGSRVAYTASNGNGIDDQRIMVYDLATGQETQWGGDVTNIARPVWMPSMLLLYALRPDEQVQWGGGMEGLINGVNWLGGEAWLLAIGWSTEVPGHTTTDPYVLIDDMAGALPKQFLPSPGAYTEWNAEPNASGDCVAFESNDGGDREIFVLTQKGAIDVTNHAAADWNPVWAPDGQWLAFESFRSGRRAIFRVFVDTARVLEVAVSDSSDNWAPAWSPDGRCMSFVSTRTGASKVFITDLDDNTVTPISADATEEYAPAWRPRAENDNS